MSAVELPIVFRESFDLGSWRSTKPLQVQTIETIKIEKSSPQKVVKVILSPTEDTPVAANYGGQYNDVKTSDKRDIEDIADEESNADYDTVDGISTAASINTRADFDKKYDRLRRRIPLMLKSFEEIYAIVDLYSESRLGNISTEEGNRLIGEAHKRLTPKGSE